ncbi:glucokinase [Roseicyclus persicicus]|uniref:Glucokinase n=1 Tax=Roseicyclus persicicus TaxID=2650661 RepID=A0A7X6H196_9RHOB|nr:glucokinase [Roseibacterium persicicum]NKX46179.1 glucokinase [Roseibacterium persicicum]
MGDLTGETGLSLVADIGGTNTRVALARGPVVDRATVTRYANAAHPDLSAVLARYLSETGVESGQITGACVAAAGPVHDGVAELTNLDWTIDRATLARALSADRVAVLNDLQAQGHAIGHIDAADLDAVLPQPEVPAHATRLVIGLGTGFNACPVFETPGGRFVPPSEAGHVSLPALCGEMAALTDAMVRDFGFASVEEVLSGRGIRYLHRVLHGVEAEPSEIMAAIAAGDAAAEATCAAFVRVTGTVVGDLALSHLPFGGIYLIGGVTRAFAPYFDRFGFAEALRSKGRFTEFMGQFGVFVVRDDYAALTGCASHLSKL